MLLLYAAEGPAGDEFELNMLVEKSNMDVIDGSMKSDCPNDWETWEVFMIDVAE